MILESMQDRERERITGKNKDDGFGMALSEPLERFTFEESEHVTAHRGVRTPVSQAVE